jgi:polysaccharide pyruvyl transferase WcaK-like protein
MKKRIAIVGWYHKQNYGDDLLQESFINILSGHFLVFWGYTPDARTLNTFDYVIFGGGSLWPIQTRIIEKILPRLKVPFALVGISARQAIDRETTYRVLESADLVILRDQASVSMLHDHPKIIVAPDLTWYIPHPVLQSPPTTSIIGLNLRQKPTLPDWKPDQIIATVQEIATETRLISFYNGHGWERNNPMDIEMMRAHGATGDLLSAEAFYQQVRLIVGMRFHALVLATQSAIPFVSFAYHPKITALHAELGLDQYCVPLDDMAQLRHAVHDLAHNYETIRAQLLDNRQMQIEQAQDRYQILRDRIEQLVVSRSPYPKSLQPLVAVARQVRDSFVKITG